MLLKLIKHEFRCTGRIMLPVLAAVLVLALFSGLSTLILTASVDVFWVLKICIYLIKFAFYVSLFAACVVAFVIMIQRFYKSLMGDEGYISMTLPVSVDSHIWTKLIVSTIWFIAVIVLCLLAIWISLSIGGYASFDFNGIKDFFNPIIKEIGPINSVGYVIEIVLIFLLSIFSSCLHFYTSMAIGCSSAKSKKLLSVVTFFIIAIVRNIASLSLIGRIPHLRIFEKSINLDTIQAATSVAHSLLGGIGFGFLILCAIYYLITRHYLTKRLNLA